MDPKPSNETLSKLIEKIEEGYGEICKRYDDISGLWALSMAGHPMLVINPLISARIYIHMVR